MNSKFARVVLLAMAAGLSVGEFCRAATITAPPSTTMSPTVTVPGPSPSGAPSAASNSTVTAPGSSGAPSVPTPPPPVVNGGKQFSFGYTQTVVFPPVPPGVPVTVTISGTGNTDPFASYSLDVSNATAGPVDILVNYYMTLTGSGITGLTNEADIFGSIVGSASLVAGTTDVQTILLTTDAVTPSTDLTSLNYSTNAGLDVGSSSFLSGLSSVTTEEGPVSAPTPAGGPFTALDIQIQFELDAHSEIRLHGEFNAPEPASLVCWSCLGLITAGVMHCRRRRQLG